MSYTLEVRQIDSDVGLKLVAPQALWNDPALLPERGHTLMIQVRRGHRIVGFWLVPLEETSDGLAARRPYRLFPYAAPWLADQDRIRRRHVMQMLVSALQETVCMIDLPLAPGFVDANGAIAAGCFAEWRHTHTMSREQWSQKAEAGFSAKARAHCRRALKSVRVEVLEEATMFPFDLAIHGDEESVQRRRHFALYLHARGSAIAFVARDGLRELGGVFLVQDRETVFLYHMWFDRQAQSGVPCLLVRHAMKWTFEQSRSLRLDFEGSILASVDHFMSSFGAEIQPYAYLHWGKSRAQTLAGILSSLDIEGRVASDCRINIE